MKYVMLVVATLLMMGLQGCITNTGLNTAVNDKSDIALSRLSSAEALKLFNSSAKLSLKNMGLGYESYSKSLSFLILKSISVKASSIAGVCRCSANHTANSLNCCTSANASFVSVKRSRIESHKPRRSNLSRHSAKVRLSFLASSFTFCSICTQSATAS